MLKNVIVPVRMKRVKDPSGTETLKATVPMNLMLEKDFDAKWLEEELIKFERRYFYLLTCLRSLLESFHSTKYKHSRLLLYWEFGNKIVEFIEQNKNGVLFLESYIKSLTRDLEISEKLIGRCKRFRLLYPDVTQINPNSSFTSYVAAFEGGYISRKRRKQEGKG